MNTYSVSSRNWLDKSQRLLIKNCGPQIGSFSTNTTAIPPFRTINVPLEAGHEASHGELARESFLGALGMVAWDAQIERDDKEGKLDKFAKEALAAYRNGDVTEL